LKVPVSQLEVEKGDTFLALQNKTAVQQKKKKIGAEGEQGNRIPFFALCGGPQNPWAINPAEPRYQGAWGKKPGMESKGIFFQPMKIGTRRTERGGENRIATATFLGARDGISLRASQTKNGNGKEIVATKTRSPEKKKGRVPIW